jgi:hypothetical protein
MRWGAAADVVRAPGLFVGDADEHELLGEELPGSPAVVGGLPQPMGDLAEQRVAAVAGTEVQDRALVGDRDEVALVVGRALAEALEVAGHVHRPDEAVRVGEVVDVLRAGARHADHVQRHGAVVGEFHAGRIGLGRRAGRCHEVRHDAHRLAAGRATHARFQRRAHRRGGAPVVVDALVGRFVRRGDGAFFGPRGVLDVATAVVQAVAGRQDLAATRR